MSCTCWYVCVRTQSLHFAQCGVVPTPTIRNEWKLIQVTIVSSCVVDMIGQTIFIWFGLTSITYNFLSGPARFETLCHRCFVCLAGLPLRVCLLCVRVYLWLCICGCVLVAVCRYGTTKEQFARVAEKNHRHSANNPRAQFQQIYSLEEILESKEIYSPFTVNSCVCVHVCVCEKAFQNGQFAPLMQAYWKGLAHSPVGYQ